MDTSCEVVIFFHNVALLIVLYCRSRTDLHFQEMCPSYFQISYCGLASQLNSIISMKWGPRLDAHLLQLEPTPIMEVKNLG